MSLTPEFGTVKRIVAIVIAVAVVVAAGTVVGQAPALFGAEIEDEPEASIEFPDQSGDGTSVTIDTVSLSNGGFVVVTNGGDIAGVSDYLPSGSHENVTVEQRTDDDLEMLGQLTATAHQDVTDDETFVADDEVEEDEDHDRPYTDDGYLVSDTATVTMEDRSDDASTSFRVESVDAPETVSTNESIDIFTEIRNPNEFEETQEVTFRIDGDLRESQRLSLGPDETRGFNFTVDTSDIEPGEHRFGIYTDDFGALGELTVEERTANVTVDNATTDEVVANTTLETDGFLVVEDGDDNESVLGVSEPLEAGEHENVTIDLSETELEDGDTLTVVVYEGEVNEDEVTEEDIEDASPAEVDGERVEVTVTIGEMDDDDGDDGDDAGTSEDDGEGDDDGEDGEDD